MLIAVISHSEHGELFFPESVRRVEKIVGKQIPSYNVDLLNKPALEEIFKKV